MESVIMLAGDEPAQLCEVALVGSKKKVMTFSHINNMWE